MNAQVIHIIDTYLTRLLPSSSASERLKPCSSLRRLAVVGILCLLVGLQSTQYATATTKEDLFKLYAHSRIIDYKVTEAPDNVKNPATTWACRCRLLAYPSGHLKPRQSREHRSRRP